MSKIDELEQKMITQGMSDEDFAEYQKMLRRVRGNFSKRQHCYTTAIQFPLQYSDKAIRVIRYGLESFEDDWFSTYTSYLYIGKIYEKASNYKEAFAAYQTAEKVLGTDHPEYIKDLSKELMWMKLHLDSFRYSPELENYYACYMTADDFSQSLIENEFRLAIVKLVIALHYGNALESKEAFDKAKEISTPGYSGKLSNIFSRHHYKESFKTTSEAQKFLENIQI